MVRKFVTEGARAVLMDRDEAAAARVAAEIGEMSGQSLATSRHSQARSGGRPGPLGLWRSRHTGQQCRRGPAALALETMDEEMFDRIANGGVSPRPNLTWCNASRAGRLPPPGPWPWNSHRSASASSPPFQACAIAPA
ncbi:hypothetical protein NKH52_24900 [Mesorhizobium sp. M1066]|uniref:hypothetical protein n=1 Tax=unclassified Mesorhizobium TaxID=325217 RepID=UPI00333E0D5F